MVRIRLWVIIGDMEGDLQELGIKEDNNLGSIKMKTPPFQGKTIPDDLQIQFDWCVNTDGFTNKCSLLNDQPIPLVLLTPQQVYEDQVRLRKE